MILSQSENENLMERIGSVVMAYFLQEPYLTKTSMNSFLPEAHEAKNTRMICKVYLQGKKAWEVINDNFIRLYINKHGLGTDNQVQISGESLNKFDFQFLDAIRDVERDMFSGRIHY